MTDDELRRLIAGEFHPSWLVHGDILELARDALRFRWLEDKAGYYGHGDYCFMEWKGNGSSIRAAIDADMEDIR